MSSRQCHSIVFLFLQVEVLLFGRVKMVKASKKERQLTLVMITVKVISWSMIIIQCMLATSGWWLLVLMRSRCLGIFGRITEIASYCSPWLTINTNSQHSTRWNAPYINSCHIKQPMQLEIFPEQNFLSFNTHFLLIDWPEPYWENAVSKLT